MTSKSQGKVPLSRHPLFPAVVGLWFAALLGIGSLAAGPALLEGLVRTLHLDAVLPAGTLPLGFTTRMVVSLVLALGGGGLAWRHARELGRTEDVPEQSAGIFARISSSISQRLARTAPADEALDEAGPVAAPDQADDNEDLARLAAARDAPAARRRPLVVNDAAPEPSAWTGLALPLLPEPTTTIRVEPTILDLGEFTANPASSAELASEWDDAAESAAAEANAGESESPVLAQTPAAPDAALPPEPPHPAAPASAMPSADEMAASRLREASLDTLDVAGLVNRFALALEARRANDFDAATAPMGAPAGPELPAAFAPVPQESAEPAPLVPEWHDDEPLADTQSPAAEFDAEAAAPTPDEAGPEDSDFGPARPFDMPATLPEPGFATADWFDPAEEDWAGAGDDWAEAGEPDEEIEEVSLETLLPQKRRTGRPFDYNGPEFDISAEVARWALPEPEEDEGEEEEYEDEDEDDGDSAGAAGNSRGFSSLLTMKPSIRSQHPLSPPVVPFVRIDDEDEDEDEEGLSEPVVQFPGQSAVPARKTMLIPGAPDNATPEETEAALREALAALRKMSGAG
ncbi:MAG: hypothetical protein KKA12_10025 [Alphaproteobacteria bacterium]|nr:hypothetical protein [Alphaproteobacteria bacterium]